MSRPATLPVRLVSQCSRYPARQCMRLRRPTSHTLLDSPSSRQWTPISKRVFSTTRANASVTAVRPVTRQKAQPSAQLSQKEQEAQALRSGKYPEDIGLLPDTLIMPRKLADRWKWSVRKKWIKTRFTELASWVSFRYFHILPRPKFPILGTTKIAQNLHVQMYNAFAAGDLSPIQNRLTTGLHSSLRARIAQRQPNTYLHWHLVKHVSRPQLVSYRAIFFPSPKDESKYERNAQIQAVVRLHTKQSLQNMRRTQKRIEGRMVVEESETERLQEKEVVENVVIQVACRKGRWGDWTLWGFADDADVGKIEKEHNEAKMKKVNRRTRSV